MPRPRKFDPTALLRPLLIDFAREIAREVEQQTLERVRAVLDGDRQLGKPARAAGRRASRPAATCYFPGCENTAAPRFGMFCAAEHKNLPSSEKEKYRRMHLEAHPTKAAAKAKTKGKVGRPRGKKSKRAKK